MKILSLFIISISVLFIQGCVTAIFLGTAAISTKAVIDPRTVGTQLDDSILKLHIDMLLSQDEQIKKETRIKSVVYQSKVLLIGQASNVKALIHAQQIVMKINGITEIYNEIRHCQPIDIKDILYDTWITAKVYSYLLHIKNIKLTNLKIITENKEVFLLGIVTEQEGKTVAEIASKIDKIKRVITAFNYIG